ncbi:endo alpha-1,4 polygalactosaminidase [Marinibaculum pumilum]|uniref:Endo alpha-1,4 polygalactosaminidase n=1 Tax=Marinibaculum pumilum TaxID=1766165 RepID=A0ABV7KX44_9PROT
MSARQRLAALLSLLGLLPMISPAAAQQSDPLRPDPLHWAVYYSDQLPAAAFADYDLVVFDGRHHPDLRSLQDRGVRLFGYINVGEVANYEPHYGLVQKMGLLGLQNPSWPDSRMVDLRDPRWTEMVLNRLIPEVLREGFDGIFLDTLDNAGYLEREDPKAYAGMTEAGRRLVRAIRRHYPDLPVILNRGYDLLPDVADAVDYVLGESVRTDYDFETKEYGWVPEDLYQEQVRILDGARRANPALHILTLDYWYPEQTDTIARIYEIERGNGFSPYVATVELDRLVPEPKP